MGEQSRRTLIRYRRTDGSRRDGLCVFLEPLTCRARTRGDMQTHEVRIDLLAYPQESLDECRSQLRTEQPPGLQHRAEGQHLTGLKMPKKEPYQGCQPDGLTK